MAGCFNFSPTVFGNRRLAAQFAAAGLVQEITDLDDTTKIQCWVPKKSPSVNGYKPVCEEKKPPLMLIHGFGANAMWQWHPQLKTLVQHFDLYIPDLVFFGGSESTRPERTEEFQAECMGRLMQKIGISKFDVAGVSYGGFVAFRMAHMFPEAVNKVVIACSGICMSPNDVGELLKRASLENVADLLLPTTPDNLKALMKLSFCKPPRGAFSFLLKDFINVLYLENREYKIELLKGIQFGKEDTPVLPTLEQEVLVIWGEADQIFPLKLGHKLREHLGKNARLVIIEHAAHAVQIERPHEFNKQMLKFFQAQ